MAGPEFVVIGEALIDLIDEGGSPYTAHAGGGPLNIAIGLSRLGRHTALLGRLSRDPLGTVLRDHARRSDVDLSLTVDAPEPSTIALVHLEEGIARYQFGVDGTADFQWTEPELDVLPPGVRAVQFGSLASWLPPGDAAISRFVRRLHDDGNVLVSYDPNVRPALQQDRDAAREQVERAVAAAHVVKASADDLDWIYPGGTIAEAAESWLGLGPSLVVITRGEKGSVAFSADGPPLEQPVHPAPVVDTVGAGDAFSSGLLDGLARRDLLDPARLHAARRDALAAALSEAAIVAAITCSRAGAQPPWANELQLD